MGKYRGMIEAIIKHMGGADNIINVTHCLTRLRFALKDEGLVDEKALLEISGVVTAQRAGGNYQVVIGSHVPEVYKEMTDILGRSPEQAEVVQAKRGVLNTIIDIITKVITPVLGVLIATGLIQGMLALLTTMGVMQPTDGAYILLHAMGNVLFQFFPVILGYTGAKAFGLDGYVGMLLGGIMVFPGIVGNLAGGEAAYTLFEGTLFQTEIFKTFFGIPIMFPAAGYASTVIPIIFATYFASKVEGFFKKRIPAIVGFTLVPFLTLVISAPIVILVIGPIANFASLLITAAVTNLYAFSPIVTAVVVAFFYQPLVILGLHWPLVTLAISNYIATGNDYILPMIYTASFAQTAVVLAVYMRTKSAKMKGICVPAIISGLFCIIEPAIYGVTLPVKKRFAFSMLGGVVGAGILAALNVRMYAISVGVLGIVGFLNPADTAVTGLIIAVFATLAAMVVAFALTYVTFAEPGDSNEGLAQRQVAAPEHFTLYAPMKGTLKNLEAAEDFAFSDGTLGQGVVIVPAEGRVVAPCDGVLTTLFPTGHAVGITSDQGVEVIVHIGKDTVQLGGKYFKKHKTQGERVRRGDLLVTFDIEALQAEGYAVETPIFVPNSAAFLDVVPTGVGAIDYGERLITVIPFRESPLREGHIS